MSKNKYFSHRTHHKPKNQLEWTAEEEVTNNTFRIQLLPRFLLPRCFGWNNSRHNWNSTRNSLCGSGWWAPNTWNTFHLHCRRILGLDPQYGLYSGIMGPFVYAFLGSCKDITIGPTAILALMVQSYVSDYGPDMAVLITFLAGCIIFILGILHLGKKSRDVDKVFTTWSHGAGKSCCKTRVCKNYGSKVQIPVFIPVEMIATGSFSLVQEYPFLSEDCLQTSPICCLRHWPCSATFTYCINNILSVL